MPKAIAIVASLAIAACSQSEKPLDCAENRNTACNLENLGTCLTAPSGNHWCAYPSGPECSSGLEWSESAGEGLAGECVMGDGLDAGVPDGGSPDADTPPACKILVAFTYYEANNTGEVEIADTDGS